MFMKKIKYDNRSLKKTLQSMKPNSEVWIVGKENHHVVKLKPDQYYYVRNKTVLDDFLNLKKLLQIIRRNEKL